MTPKEHPEPTAATVKALYGTAFRCAHPDCSKPLYRLANDTGEFVLNSRVAHIHARRPGGPRWVEMSDDANRSASNLVLLCIEHSYEVDEHPDLYPAETMLEWKSAQLREHDELQKAWPLDEVEVGRVMQASFSPAEAYQQTSLVTAVVRASAQLATAARTAREIPGASAAKARDLRNEYRRHPTGWDTNGNSVYAEPPRADTDRYRASIVEGLQAATQQVRPHHDALKVELMVARTSRADIAPWAEWVERVADDAFEATQQWPKADDFEDDDRLENAVEDLRAATDAFASAWRGDTQIQPPVPTADTDETADPLHDHRELLERARPHARVDHLKYDPELRHELGIAAEFAAGIPPVMTFLTIDLHATCGLAAATTKNATEAEREALLEDDSRRRPLSAAVSLLAESARRAEQDGNSVHRDLAAGALIQLWESIDWSALDTWDASDANMASVFSEVSILKSPEHVRERLADAVTHNPQIALLLVEACAQWVEHHDFHDFDITGFSRQYRRIPPYLPTAGLIKIATSVAPTVSQVVVDEYGQTSGADPVSLLAQILHQSTS